METLVKDLESIRLATETLACLARLVLRTLACADPSLDPHDWESVSVVPTECVTGVSDPVVVQRWHAMVRCCLYPAYAGRAQYPDVPCSPMADGDSEEWEP